MQQELYYKEALKLGQKEVRAKIAKNENPYLPALDELIQPEKALTGIRLRKLWLPLKKHHGFDILLTHAAAFGLNDFETIPHRGFQCFLTLMDQYEPAYFIHGHIRRNYVFRVPQRDQHGKKLVDFIVRNAQQEGYRELSIGVDLDNDPALRLYTQMGFDRIVHIGEDEYGRFVKLIKEL